MINIYLFSFFFSEPQGVVPSVVVGVVGIGHVEGIRENWDREINVKELLRFVHDILSNLNVRMHLDLHFVDALDSREGLATAQLTGANLITLLQV